MVAGPGFVGLSADAWGGFNKEPVYGVQQGPASAENFLFLSESLHSERRSSPCRTSRTPSST